VNIGAEIMAENFDRKTLVEMSQMELPTDAEVKKQIKDLEDQAEQQIKAMNEQAQEMVAQAQQQMQQLPPDQAQAMQQQIPQQMQQFQQQQQQLIDQFGQKIAEAGQQVTIDQVMEFIDDEKLRPFVLDIETDSTVYPDEAMEKAQRAEFMQAFTGVMAGLQPLMALGPEAVSLIGAMLKFSLAPYRVGRELDGMIDDFSDQGPAIAQQMQQQASKGESAEMAEANMQLAKAETMKAQAAIAKVQADTQKSQQEMQLKAAEAQARAQADQQKLQLELASTKGNIAETHATIRKIEAEIVKLGVDAQNQTRTQDREDSKLVADVVTVQQDQQRADVDQQRAIIDSARSHARADRGEDRADIQTGLNGK
jgi:vacuolar-type H+-ATPase subunit H